MDNPAFSISPEAFVQEFKDLKDHLLVGYFSPTSGISRIAALQEAGLTKEQIAVAREVVNGALTDALYTVRSGWKGVPPSTSTRSCTSCLTSNRMN